MATKYQQIAANFNIMAIVERQRDRRRKKLSHTSYNHTKGVQIWQIWQKLPNDKKEASLFILVSHFK